MEHQQGFNILLWILHSDPAQMCTVHRSDMHVLPRSFSIRHYYDLSRSPSRLNSRPHSRLFDGRSSCGGFLLGGLQMCACAVCVVLKKREICLLSSISGMFSRYRMVHTHSTIWYSNIMRHVLVVTTWPRTTVTDVMRPFKVLELFLPNNP